MGSDQLAHTDGARASTLEGPDRRGPEAQDLRGLVFDVRRFSIHDGPGIRTAVFFKGCPLSCWWCHNPESRGRRSFVHYDAGRCLRCGACVDACPSGALSPGDDVVVLDPARCTSAGACVHACPAEARRWVGRPYGVAGLVAEIDRDRLFHEQSGGGVTFTGGEPLLQWRFLCAVLDACGRRGIHRAVDTSGFAAPAVVERVARRTDLFLFDLKTPDPVRHEEVTGVPLRPILDNLGRLLGAGARVRVRMPLIPGINDDDATIDRAADLLAGFADRRAPEGVDLLPYHSLAREKHARFGLPWRLEDDAALPDRRVDEIRARLESPGLRVSIGG